MWGQPGEYERRYRWRGRQGPGLNYQAKDFKLHAVGSWEALKGFRQGTNGLGLVFFKISYQNLNRKWIRRRVTLVMRLKGSLRMKG